MRHTVAALAVATCGGAFGGSVFGDARGGGNSGNGGAPAPETGAALIPVTRAVVTAVPNTQNGWATVYSWQPKLFKMAGLYWVFYGNGAATFTQVYRTSADLITWSSATTVRTTSSFGAGLGHRIGYYYDGTYIHYAACDSGDGDDALYRRGTPNSDGTITWSAAEQTVLSVDASHACGYPTVWVDSGGNPWVGMQYAAAPSWSSPLVSRVIKSSATDGTWTTAATQDLQSNTAIYPVPVCVPLTAGKVYCAWSQNTYPDVVYRGRRYNGSSWDAAEDVSTSFGGYSLITLAPDGDAVHALYLDGANMRVIYRLRSAGGSWGSEVDLEHLNGGFSDTATPLIVNLGSRQRACWEDLNIYHCRDIISGAASGASYVLSDESVSGIASQSPLQGLSLGDGISAAWASVVGVSPSIISLLQEQE